MDAVHADEIKGMYIMGENPAMSDPDLNHARGALAHLEHLVVQDIFLTETCSYADVILPASAWPEKDGTVTNTNRQVQMGRKALPLPGDARQDLWIIQDLAQRMGENWNYKHVSEVFTEMARLMPALDNISWERVEREDHVTYPTDAPDQPGRDVVFDKGFPRPGGFGKLVAAKLTPPDETPDARLSVHPHHRPPARALAHRRHDAARHRARRAGAVRRSPRCRAARSRSSASSPATCCASPRGAARSNWPSRQDDAIPDGVVFIPFAYRRGGGQSPDQSGARSVRQDSGIQILRGQGGEGAGAEADRRRSRSVHSRRSAPLNCSAVRLSSPTTRNSIRPIKSARVASAARRSASACVQVVAFEPNSTVPPIMAASAAMMVLGGERDHRQQQRARSRSRRRRW